MVMTTVLFVMSMVGMFLFGMMYGHNRAIKKTITLLNDIEAEVRKVRDDSLKNKVVTRHTTPQA